MHPSHSFSRTAIALGAALLALNACAGERDADQVMTDTSLENDLSRVRVAKVGEDSRGDDAARGTAAGDVDVAQRETDPATGSDARTPSYDPAAAAPITTRAQDLTPQGALPQRSPSSPTTPAPEAAPVARPENPGITPPPSPPPQPRAPSPVTAGQPVARPTGTPTIAAGRSILLATNDRVCTSAKAGKQIGATVRTRAVGSHGAEIPAGATVVLEVTSTTPEAEGQLGTIAFRPRTVAVSEASHPLAGRIAAIDPLQRTRIDSKGEDAALVIGGAVLGAAAGQAVGKDTKSTVAGAAAGAAAGAVAASANERYDMCLPPGSRVRLTLEQPLVM